MSVEYEKDWEFLKLTQTCPAPNTTKIYPQFDLRNESALLNEKDGTEAENTSGTTKEVRFFCRVLLFATTYIVIALSILMFIKHVHFSVFIK